MRPPPIQFRPEEPKPQGNKVLAWTLRIVGLIAVAVISGLVWWYIQNDEPRDGSRAGGETTQQGEGAYQFDVHKDMRDPRTDDNCADHAYGKTQQFFQEHPCDKLTRALFVTKVSGRTVYTSVSVVRMSDEETAAALRDLTDTDETGNVKDLVRDGDVKIKGLDSLSKGYDSTQHGRDVVIVESAFDPKEKEHEGDGKLLDEVCTDALRLGSAMSGNAG